VIRRGSFRSAAFRAVGSAVPLMRSAPGTEPVSVFQQVRRPGAGWSGASRPAAVTSADSKPQQWCRSRSCAPSQTYMPEAPCRPLPHAPCRGRLSCPVLASQRQRGVVPGSPVGHRVARRVGWRLGAMYWARFWVTSAQRRPRARVKAEGCLLVVALSEPVRPSELLVRAQRLSAAAGRLAGRNPRALPPR
jgi:hypothetical protein